MRLADDANAHSFGEAVVDGLLAGVGAGGVMAACLVLAGLALGVGPGPVLGSLDVSGANAPAAGLLAHLAVAGVFGAVFGGAWRFTPWRRTEIRLSLLCGLGYGGLLWATAAGLWQPALAGRAHLFAGMPAWQLLAAHSAYGLTLSLLFSRSLTLAGARRRANIH